MNKNNVSTILSVALALLILSAVMLISLTATTEADESFKPTDQEEQGMIEYYNNCPFKKAELADLTAQASIREYVQIESVECHPETKVENVIVHLLGDTTVSKSHFQNWLNMNHLSLGESLVIEYR